MPDSCLALADPLLWEAISRDAHFAKRPIKSMYLIVGLGAALLFYPGKTAPQHLQEQKLLVPFVNTWGASTPSGPQHRTCWMPGWPSRCRQVAAQSVDQAVARMPAPVEDDGPTHRWFNPVKKFGPVAGSKGSDAPLLLFIPGSDGSGCSPAAQFPELASAFEVQSLSFMGADRSTYDDIKANVRAKVHEAKAKGREVHVMGESFGATVALSLGMDDSDPAAMPDGIILVNSASCYDRTLLGRNAPVLVKMPEPFFTISMMPAAFCIFDSEVFSNVGKAMNGGFPHLESEDRQKFMKKIYPAFLDGLVNTGSADLKWRISQWMLPGCREVSTNLKNVKVPTLVIAGTADLVLPSQEEALRLKNEVPHCTVRLVEGAGHIGVLDARTDLLGIIRSWLGSGSRMTATAKKAAPTEPPAKEILEGERLIRKGVFAYQETSQAGQRIRENATKIE
eukprot:gnl/TRDRNA2_/TRDRNA2_168806_c0_seq2.p1 gnl/TRDRNA2_/TRDRNA2_168806_c0~~gnl/TRDRNA2_/TRDRNA2_168806_c0_seq2.p1  ORF type:complete len:451 (-),score=72.95 gnl/TRDRNA2_/TRDRNA2_168806_c0_seq2:192-1544(-)